MVLYDLNCGESAIKPQPTNRMSALGVVRLPPLANVPAQRMRPTNAFASVRGDKKAMWPFAKLLYTLVYIVINIILVYVCNILC